VFKKGTLGDLRDQVAALCFIISRTRTTRNFETTEFFFIAVPSTLTRCAIFYSFIVRYSVRAGNFTSFSIRKQKTVREKYETEKN